MWQNRALQLNKWSLKFKYSRRKVEKYQFSSITMWIGQRYSIHNHVSCTELWNISNMAEIMQWASVSFIAQWLSYLYIKKNKQEQKWTCRYLVREGVATYPNINILQLVTSKIHKCLYILSFSNITYSSLW